MKYLINLCAALALLGCSSTIDSMTALDSGVDAQPADVVSTVDIAVADVATDRSLPDASVRTCRTSADCAASEECLGDMGCAIPWTCQPRVGRACTHDLVQFCNCNGVTVSGSSTCPPQPFAFRGPCTDPPACPLPHGGTCPAGMTCPAGDGCNSCTCAAGGMLACTERDCETDGGAPDVVADAGPAACRLTDGARCPAGRTCPAGDGCNDCTCDPMGMLHCTARPCAFDAGATRPTCFSSLDCRSDEECAGTAGCATPWTCRAASSRLCDDDAAAYCGCDGRTFYGSSSCPPRPYARLGACGDGGV